jgi:mono/diheme cytochrome c family protein
MIEHRTRHTGRILNILILIILVFISGCYRGEPSEKPPIHPNPDMDDQSKFEPQEQNKFFDNGAAMREPVEGTVARGYLREDTEFYRGMTADGEYVKKAPIEINEENMERGRERYDIYCSPCHSRVGDGRGIVISKGYPPATSLHDNRILKMPDGQIYDAISNGIRNMPSYKEQIRPDDRWKIVIYVRALQRSQNATIDDIPENLRDDVK